MEQKHYTYNQKAVYVHKQNAMYECVITRLLFKCARHVCTHILTSGHSLLLPSTDTSEHVRPHQSVRTDIQSQNFQDIVSVGRFLQPRNRGSLQRVRQGTELSVYITNSFLICMLKFWIFLMHSFWRMRYEQKQISGEEEGGQCLVPS